MEIISQAAPYYDLIAYQDVSRIYLAKKKGLTNSFLNLPSFDKKLIKNLKFLILKS